jgi:hypothetical protein
VTEHGEVQDCPLTIMEQLDLATSEAELWAVRTASMVSFLASGEPVSA